MLQVIRQSVFRNMKLIFKNVGDVCTQFLDFLSTQYD